MFHSPFGKGTFINTVDDYNTVLGFNAGTRLNTPNAINNTFIGALAGAGDDQARNVSNVTVIGAGANAVKSNQAIFGGPDTTETVLRGRIVINGLNALRLDDQANDNTYGLGAGPAGDSTGASNGTGNLALGKLALAGKNTNISCVALGYKALTACDTGIDHTAVGVGAAQSQRGGVGCTAVGREAGFRSINGTNWTALGDTALRDNMANLNVGVGYGAARDNTTGSVIAIGTYAAGYTKTAQRVTIVGTEAFGGQGHGDDNTGVGYRAGSVMLGSGNSIFGSEALLLAGTFTDVTALGYRAGFTTTGGMRNTFVGARAGKNDASQKTRPMNTIALGADTFTTKDNQTVIGNADSDELVLHGVAFSRVQLLALKAMLG